MGDRALLSVPELLDCMPLRKDHLCPCRVLSSYCLVWRWSYNISESGTAMRSTACTARGSAYMLVLGSPRLFRKLARTSASSYGNGCCLEGGKGKGCRGGRQLLGCCHHYEAPGSFLGSAAVLEQSLSELRLTAQVVLNTLQT